MAETISRKSVIYDIDYDFSKGNKSAEEAGKKVKDVDRFAKSLGDTFKNANKVFGDAFNFANVKKFGEEVEKAAAKTKTLIGQLREMKNTLAQLDPESARFIKLSVEAAKLEDRIERVNQRVRNLASNTKNLDAFLSAATAISGAFAVAQGAAALLGDENKDLQKSLLKVQASIAILNGLQQVSATIQNESAAKTFIVTNAQKAYAFAVGASTKATRIFNTALLLGVGGIAIAAIALVVTYWQDIAKFIGIAADNQKELNAAQQEYRKRLEDSQKVLNENDRVRRETAEGGINDIKRTIAFLEAEGNQEGKVFDLKQLLRKKELDELKIQLSEVEKLRSISIGEQLKQINILSDAIKDKENEIRIATINRLKDTLVQYSALNKVMLENIGINSLSQKSIEEQTQARIGDTKSIEETIAALGELAKAQGGKSVEKSTVIADQLKEQIELVNQYVGVLGSVASAIEAVDSLQSQNAEREINAINEQAETQISAIQRQIEAKQKLGQETIDLEQKIKDIEQARAQREKEINDRRKKNALTLIILEQAVALAQGVTLATKASTPIEFIAAIAAILSTIISTISQAKAVANSASFFEGTEYLQKGKNKSGKDTIPIMANEGEAIIPTDKNAQEPGLAKAWIDGTLDKYIYRNYVMPEMIRATGKTKSEKDYSEKFYRQWLETKETNGISKKALGVLTRIERGLSSDYYKSRYNA